MPGRSPHRRSPPPPPFISRHSPPRNRIRSSDYVEMPSSSHGRERREFRPTRRSRSPPPKRRSFSPPLKRKISPSMRERELIRRTKISKSPVGSRRLSDAPYIVNPTEPDIHPVRTTSGSERFRSRPYDGERRQALPHFRGPESSVDYDISDLKKFTVEILRKAPNGGGDGILNRTITNPDDIAPVRRPDEGARPLFLRVGQSAGSSKDRSHAGPSDEYQRIVAVDTSRTRERERSHERARYSPGYYEDQRRSYYPERAPVPYESHHRSPPRYEYVESREKIHERRASSREDVRRDLDGRRGEERRYSPERRSYERESDLRTRINEKRGEPHPRAEEREHSSRRYESERERHSSRTHHSPPRERKRGGSLEHHESYFPGREGPWEKEGGGERRRPPHSREHEERGREFISTVRYEEFDKSRRFQPYKTDFEPKNYYKTYDEKEFNAPPIRGRGGPIRRGMPPLDRGRGYIRGMSRGFRGGIMRGAPKGPYRGIRGGFPPRFFPPF